MSITKRELKNGKIVYDNQFMYKGIRYKKRGFKSKGEAENWEIDVKYEVNRNGSYFQPCSKTFIQVWEEYFTLEKDKYALATFNTYRLAATKIKKDKISKMKIVDINYSAVQNYFNKLAKNYNKSTCNIIKMVFNLTFKHAIRCEYIKNNPMPYVINKGKETKDKNKKNIITYEEFMTVCEYFLDKGFNFHSIYIALNIGYYTGARISEVLALNKCDIDFNNHTITFNKRLENTVKNPYVATMKTHASYGVVPLAEPLEKILKEWFKVNPYEIICVKENGEYFKHSYIYTHLLSMTKECGIPFHFHMLRHTYASNLIMNGINPSVAKNLLRHADIQTTLNIYTHSDIDNERKAVQTVFTQNKKGNYPKITPKLN